jgi:hypothetical protein
VLGGTAQTTESTQSEDKPPFQVGTCGEHLGCGIKGYKVKSFGVCLDGRFQFCKRIRFDKLPANGGRKKLLGNLRMLANGVFAHSLGEQEYPPVVGVASGNVAQVPAGATATLA